MLFSLSFHIQLVNSNEMIMRLLLSGILLLASPFQVLCDASPTTYNLLYDGFLAAGSGGPRDSDPAADLAMVVANGILQAYTDMVESALSVTKENERIHVDDQRCYDTANGEWCTVDRVAKDGAMLHVATYASKQGATRIDTTLTASDGDSIREALVQSLTRINERLGVSNSNDSSVWSIRHRPSLMEAKANWNDIDIVAATQDDRDIQAASLENIILGNARLRNRTRIEHVFVHATNRATQSSTSTELWQYDNVDFNDPVKDLFIDGKLQTTTSPSSAAHAEALVHPALIAHTNPKRIAVISKTPSAIVKEVLKHKSVESVLVAGADKTALDMVERHMPSLHDCSFLGNADPNCMHQECVHIVDKSLADWLLTCRQQLQNDKDSQCCLYDAILVDVSIGTSDWLSVDLYRDIVPLCRNDETILVISSGSRPSLFDKSTETIMSARDTLIREVARSSEHGGLYMDVWPFDEPLAQPLSSTFMAVLFDTSKISYTRFVRRNSAAIDIDIVNRFHSNIPGPTKVYDGPTHKGYMVPSRAWENHYCNTLPGRDMPMCTSFLSNWMDPSYHHLGLAVKQDPVKGRTVFATEDIPKGHFVNSIDAAMSWRLEQDLLDALVQFVDDYPDATMYRDLLAYLMAYGFVQDGIGIMGFGVSVASISTFTNHACSEEEACISGLDGAGLDEDGEEIAYSPPCARRPEVVAQLVVATRDIKAGEEILQDYSPFRDESDEDYQRFLKEMCKDGRGLVPVDEGIVENKSSGEF